LAVVKGLAEAMGGSVLARPSALGGLGVVVRLQIDSEPELAAEVETEEGGAAKPAAEPAAAPAGVSAPAEAR
jgi:hypothetical protein